MYLRVHNSKEIQVAVYLHIAHFSGILPYIMKKDIHPDNYRYVIFRDNSSGKEFLIGSAVETTETSKWTDGKEYPLYSVEISSASHPFYTGKEKMIDTAGRVEKFKTRQAKAQAKSTKAVLNLSASKAKK